MKRGMGTMSFHPSTILWKPFLPSLTSLLCSYVKLIYCWFHWKFWHCHSSLLLDARCIFPCNTVCYMAVLLLGMKLEENTREVFCLCVFDLKCHEMKRLRMQISGSQPLWQSKHFPPPRSAPRLGWQKQILEPLYVSEPFLIGLYNIHVCDIWSENSC